MVTAKPGLSKGSLSPELEKGLKELRGFAAPLSEQPARTSPPQAPRDRTTNQIILMKEHMAPSTYEIEDVLVCTSVEEWPLSLRWFNAPNAVEC